MKRRALTAKDYVILNDLRIAKEEGMTAIEIAEKHIGDERLVGVALEREVRRLHENKYIGRTLNRRTSSNTKRQSVVYVDLHYGEDEWPFLKRQCECPSCGHTHTWNGNPEWNPDFK